MKRTLFALSVASALIASVAWADGPQCRPKTDNQAEKLCSPADFKFICVNSAASFGLTCPTGVAYQCAQAAGECSSNGSILALKGAASGNVVRAETSPRTGSISETSSTDTSKPVKTMDATNVADGSVDSGMLGNIAGGVPGLPVLLQLPITQPPTGTDISGYPGLSNIATQLQKDEQALRSDLLSKSNQLLTNGQPNGQPDPSIIAGLTDYSNYSQDVTKWNAMVGQANKSLASTNSQLAKNRDSSPGSRSTQTSLKSNSKDGGDCDVSTRLDGSMSCSGTANTIKVGQAMNVAGQVAGSYGTQIAGAQAQTQALNAGTQSSIYKGAASTAMMSGESQVTVGMFNAMMGAMMMQKGSKHARYAKQINRDFKATGSDGNLYAQDGADQSGTAWKAADSSETLVDKSIGNGGRGLNEVTTVEQDQNAIVARKKRNLDNLRLNQSWNTAAINSAQEDYVEAQQNAARAMSRAGMNAGQRAMDEQSKMADDAKSAGLMSLMQGGQQLAQGILAVASAKQLESAAKEMAASEAAAGLTLQPPGQDQFPATAARSPTLINGLGASPTPSAASADQQPTDSGVPPLGAGLPGPIDGAPNGAPVIPGKFVPGTGTAAGGAGGAGAGGLSGGSTQPPGPDNNEKGPMAANPYVAGSTPVSGGGLVGPPPPGAKEDRLNPADMMAAALGMFKKGGDEGGVNSQAYSRNPASASGSLNGFGLPEDNLFQIIESGIRKQVQAGNIGG